MGTGFSKKTDWARQASSASSSFRRFSSKRAFRDSAVAELIAAEMPNPNPWGMFPEMVTLSPLPWKS